MTDTPIPAVNYINCALASARECATRAYMYILVNEPQGLENDSDFYGLGFRILVALSIHLELSRGREPAEQ